MCQKCLLALFGLKLPSLVSLMLLKIDQVNSVDRLGVSIALQHLGFTGEEFSFLMSSAIKGSFDTRATSGK